MKRTVDIRYHELVILVMRILQNQYEHCISDSFYDALPYVGTDSDDADVPFEECVDSLMDIIFTYCGRLIYDELKKVINDFCETNKI